MIIAFNIMDRASFDNVKPVWFKEKKKDMKKAKVGNFNSKGSKDLKTHPLKTLFRLYSLEPSVT